VFDKERWLSLFERNSTSFKMESLVFLVQTVSPVGKNYMSCEGALQYTKKAELSSREQLRAIGILYINHVNHKIWE
jgi:hypothetical protein